MQISTKTAPSVSSPITLTTCRTITANPYIQLAAKVSQVAQSMQADAAEIASLITAKLASPLTPKQEKRLGSLYDRLDGREKSLAEYLAH